MKVEVKVKWEELDVEAYLAAVRETIRKAFKEAGRRYLVAAAPPVISHIFTGFTRGSFRNLEDAVEGSIRAEGSGIRIRTGGSSSKNTIKGQRSGGRRYYYYPPGGGRVLRTPEAGRGFSTPSGKIFSVANSKTTFYFRFDISIVYFLKSSWGKKALQDGEDAFLAVMNNVKLPDYLKYMKVRTI